MEPQSVKILDEASKLIGFTRSEVIREAVDGASSRVGKMLSLNSRKIPSDYLWLEKIIGSVSTGRKKVNLSENVDEIYYK